MIQKGYKKTKIGIIPNDWEVVKLGEIAEINPKTKPIPKKFIYIDLESVKNGNLLKTNTLTKEKAPSRAKRVLEKNDILFQMVRPYQMNNFLFNLNGSYVASTGYAQIRTNQNIIFIFQYLHYPKFVSIVVEKCTGSNYPAINTNDLSEILISLPPLKEQEKIAKILTLWDNAILKQSNLINEKENFKKALMQRLLSGKIHFPEFKDKWKKVRLGDICQIKTGKLNANSMTENGKYPFFTCAKEVYRIDNYMFNTEALLISGNGANVGYIHYYNGKFNAYQRTYVLDEFKNNIFFIKYFLDHYLSSKILKEKNEGNVPYITLPTLIKMKILLPSLQEQEKIANILTLCDDEINLLKTELENLKEQKQGLMQKLLSGKVRVKI